jgi:hypothetical protein
MPISSLPSAPQSSDPSATFISKADAFVASLSTLVTEMNAAIASVNMTKWISGTTYAIGDVTWSPTTFYAYRRKTAGAGTTDPSADATNWIGIISAAAGANTDITSITGNAATATNASQLGGVVAASYATTTYADGMRDVPANAQTTSYSLISTDRGKSIDTTAGVTIPLNSTTALAVGHTTTITNTSAVAITITQAASVTLRQAGTANTGNRTLAAYGVATVRKVATDTWFISGAGLT